MAVPRALSDEYLSKRMWVSTLVVNVMIPTRVLPLSMSKLRTNDAINDFITSKMACPTIVEQSSITTMSTESADEAITPYYASIILPLVALLCGLYVMLSNK